MNFSLNLSIINASSYADIRGTLMVGKNVPVAFQSIGLEVKFLKFNLAFE